MKRKHDQTGRSKGEARHVRLYHWMMGSAAWKSLGALARAIYVEIASRYAGPGSNNGRIGYSVRTAAEALGVSPATASRALRQLEEAGFIVCITKGGFSMKIRHATEWRLTEFRCDITSEMATKDFMRWQPSVSQVKQKMQKPVPVVKLAVPVVEQHGGFGETVDGPKASDGTSSGTVKAQNTPPTVSPQSHIYVYQGEVGGATSSHLQIKNTSKPAHDEPRLARNHVGSTAERLLNTSIMRRAALKGEKQ